MKRSKWAMTMAALLMALAGPPMAQADQGPVRIAVEPFATLPDGVRYPEGIASNPGNGEIYVGTFDARMPESVRNNQLLRYSADGRLLAKISFGQLPLTGLAFAGGKVYVLNFGSSKLHRVDAAFTASTPVEDVVQFKALSPPAPVPRRIENPDGSQDTITFGSNGLPAPNGMVFDRGGNLYVSDSLQGAILRIDRVATCAPCTAVPVSRDPLLATSGYLPFGANGLAFDAAEKHLYINNAGDSRLLRMQMPAGPVSIVAESIHGADGLLFHEGLLWVASNQADVVLALDDKGRTVVQAGEFLGIGSDGAPRGLLFPASTTVQGDWMVVTNLALPLTATDGDEWEERVTRWNLVRFRIPKFTR